MRLILFLLILLVPSYAYAVKPTSWELKRITPVNIKGQSYVGQPWVHFNKDNTRLMIFENSSLINQAAGEGIITGEAVADTTNPIEGTLSLPSVQKNSITFTDSSGTPQVVTDNGSGKFTGDIETPPDPNGSITYHTAAYSFSFANPPVAPITVSYNSAGRGFVYGTISDFTSWTDFADYQSKIKPVPSPSGEATPGGIGSNLARSYDVVWSNVTGEEDIIYYIIENGTGLDVVKADTTAGTASVILNIPDSGDFTYIDIAGNKAPALAGWIDADYVDPVLGTLGEGHLQLLVPREVGEKGDAVTPGYIAIDVTGTPAATWVSSDGNGSNGHATGYPNGDNTHYPISSCANNDYGCATTNAGGGCSEACCVDKYEDLECSGFPELMGHGHWVYSLSNNYFIFRSCTTAQRYTSLLALKPDLITGFTWTATGSEYRCNTGLSKPTRVYENSSTILTEGTVNSLAVGEWGYSSPYLHVRLSDDTSPTGKSAGYLRYMRDLETGSGDPLDIWQQRLIWDSEVDWDATVDYPGTWNAEDLGSTHFSWFNTDDDWIIGSKSATTSNTTPHVIDNVNVYIYHWDGLNITDIDIITGLSTASRWDAAADVSPDHCTEHGWTCTNNSCDDNNDDDCEDNGSVQPRAIGSHDGKYAIMTSTNGLLSIEDKLKWDVMCAAEPYNPSTNPDGYDCSIIDDRSEWDMGGVWLITFDPAAAASTGVIGSLTGSGDFR